MLSEPAQVSASSSATAARGSQPGSPKRPFRADQVGSLLRPPELMQARAAAEAGEMDADGLQGAEDVAIRRVVEFQESIGLPAVSDGEYRRASFHLDFLRRVAGVEIYQDPKLIRFHKHSGEEIDYSPPRTRVSGRISRPSPIMLRDYQFLASVVTKATPKITIPSPSMTYRIGRAGVDRTAYPEIEAFFDDLADVYRQEVDDLAAAGCRYLQMDDTNLAYLCDEELRENTRRGGEDPDQLPHTYARLINQAIATAPGDLYTAIHLCRGNHRSAFVAQGGYEPVAEILFNEIDVDTFLLEYDDAALRRLRPAALPAQGQDRRARPGHEQAHELESPRTTSSVGSTRRPSSRYRPAGA